MIDHFFWWKTHKTDADDRPTQVGDRPTMQTTDPYKSMRDPFFWPQTHISRLQAHFAGNRPIQVYDSPTLQMTDPHMTMRDPSNRSVRLDPLCRTQTQTGRLETHSADTRPTLQTINRQTQKSIPDPHCKRNTTKVTYRPTLWTTDPYKSTTDPLCKIKTHKSTYDYRPSNHSAILILTQVN